MTRVAMVSAGLHGLGRAISEALANDGYRVWATTTDPSITVSAPATPYRWDLADPHRAQQWIDEVRSQESRIDVLVNNLGPYLWDYPAVRETDEDAWNFILDTNLTLAYQLSRLVLPVMRSQKAGTIINIGYVGAGTARGWRLRGAYAAAKSGLASLTRTIALEEQSHGITCAMICPSDIRDGDKETAVSNSERLRPPTGHDVARLVPFLADPASFYLSGNVIELAPRWDPPVHG